MESRCGSEALLSLVGLEKMSRGICVPPVETAETDQSLKGWMKNDYKELIWNQSSPGFIYCFRDPSSLTMNHFQSSADPLEGNSASCSCTVCPEVLHFLAHLLCAQQRGLPRAETVPSCLSPRKGILSLQPPEVYTHHKLPEAGRAAWWSHATTQPSHRILAFQRTPLNFSVVDLLT